jgi:hypothetical protein
MCPDLTAALFDQHLRCRADQSAEKHQQERASRRCSAFD